MEDRAMTLFHSKNKMEEHHIPSGAYNGGSPPSAQVTQTSGVCLFVLPSTRIQLRGDTIEKHLSGPGRATVLHFDDSKVAIATSPAEM